MDWNGMEQNRIDNSVGRDFKDHQVKLPGHVRTNQKWNILFRVLFKCLLYTDRHGAPTISLGRLFQSLPTLIINNLLLMFNLNLPWCSFVPFPCTVLSVTKDLPLDFPWSRNCREHWSLSVLSLSFPDMSSTSFVSFVALHWMHWSILTPF